MSNVHYGAVGGSYVVYSCYEVDYLQCEMKDWQLKIVFLVQSAPIPIVWVSCLLVLMIWRSVNFMHKSL